MNVVYDLLGFQSRHHGDRGIARYVLQLALGLERIRPGLVTQYLMHPDLPFPAGAEPLVATGRVVRSDRQEELRRPSGAGVFLAGSPFEAYHLPSEHVLPSFTRSGSWRSAAVLHDLVPHRFPEIYLKRPEERFTYAARLAAMGRVDHVLANSLATAREAVEFLHTDPQRVTVIGAGADARFQPPARPREEVVASLVAEGTPPGLRPGYVLLPTNTDPRKNLERALRAWGRLHPDLRRRHQLVLVCNLDEADRQLVDRWVEEAGIGQGFLATGYVTDDLLCRLYQGAELVVFPSLYEGFGLPALEAMSCGAPVVCGDGSALQEVQTLDAARFDPGSEASIAETVGRSLTDRDFRRQLLTFQVLPQFTWDAAARITGSVVDQLLAPEHVRLVRPPARIRLALFGPTGWSDAGRYLHRLVDELRLRCDVTVFTADGGSEGAAFPDEVAIHPSSRFDAVERGGGAFDQVINVLAGEAGAVDALRSLRRRGGWAILHDLRLTELYGALADRFPGEVPAGHVGQLVIQHYPHRYHPNLEALDRIDGAVAERAGIVLAREVAALAERVLAHSPYEATVVALDTGARVDDLYPLPCPDIDAGPSARHREPVISHFGPIRRGRGLEDLVTVLARARKAVPGTTLRLVGDIEATFADELKRLAMDHGIARALDLVGPLPPHEEAAIRRESMLAIQFDDSAWAPITTIGRLLASGAPTLVRDIGPATELPDDAVVKITPGTSAGDVAATVVALLFDPDRRDELAEAGFRYAKAASYANAAAAIREQLAL